MICIRTDGNKEIGMGHVMRCLTIAASARDLGAQVMFVTADEACVSVISERGFHTHVLQRSFREMDGEIHELRDFLLQIDCTCLLIDSYFVTPNYFAFLRDDFYVAYMDDVMSFPYQVDLLINYNVFADENEYRQQGFWAEGTLLAGCRYAPIRDEFENYRVTPCDFVHDVFLSLGGSDHYNLTLKITKQIRKTFPQLVIHAICGPFFTQASTLKKMAAEDDHLVLYENLLSLASIMQKCNIAISAAGTTMYELAATGAACITFSFVDNQKRIAKGFVSNKAALFGGNYEPAEEDLFLEHITKALREFCDNKELRLQTMHNARALVDGMGATRVAEALIHATSTHRND